MQEFSLNVLGKSVPISMETISTAWFCKLCFLTNSSLHRMAAADPSEVGLKTQILKFCHTVPHTHYICISDIIDFALNIKCSMLNLPVHVNHKFYNSEIKA